MIHIQLYTAILTFSNDLHSKSIFHSESLPKINVTFKEDAKVTYDCLEEEFLHIRQLTD